MSSFLSKRIVNISCSSFFWNCSSFFLNFGETLKVEYLFHNFHIDLKNTEMSALRTYLKRQFSCHNEVHRHSYPLCFSPVFPEYEKIILYKTVQELFLQVHVYTGYIMENLKILRKNINRLHMFSALESQTVVVGLQTVTNF